MRTGHVRCRAKAENANPIDSARRLRPYDAACRERDQDESGSKFAPIH